MNSLVYSSLFGLVTDTLQFRSSFSTSHVALSYDGLQISDILLVKVLSLSNQLHDWLKVEIVIYIPSVYLSETERFS